VTTEVVAIITTCGTFASVAIGAVASAPGVIPKPASGLGTRTDTPGSTGSPAFAGDDRTVGTADRFSSIRWKLVHGN
jgi:hypothetical protein